MSEHNLQAAPADLMQFEPQNAEIINMPQHEQFNAYLGNLESLGIITDPERKAKIQEAGQELIDDFGLTEKFFEDDSKSIIFAAVANDYVDLKEMGDTNVGAVTAHKEFLADTLVLLAGKESAYADVYEGSSTQDEISDEKKLAAYDKFTNVQVSAEMTEAVKPGGLIDDVRERLGITADNESAFEIRVLDILSQGGNEAGGMRPSQPSELRDAPYNHPDLISHMKDSELYKAYEDGLKQKGKEFNVAMGREGDSFAPAWITTVDGKTLLCIPLPTAEKILYPGEKRSKDYTEADRERDIATLKHEYTHTQQGVSINGEPLVGIGLEELRAEHFSGNKQGYTEIKRHFTYMSKLNGFHPKQVFEEKEDGELFSPSKFYEKIAANVGLDGLLESVSVFPPNYINDESGNSLQRSINSYIGGIDGLQAKAWDRALGVRGIDAIEESLRQMSKSISELMDPESFYHYAGFSFIAKKALALWEKEKPVDYEDPRYKS